MDLGSGPLESFNHLPAGELIRSLWTLFGMALPICSTYRQPVVTADLAGTDSDGEGKRQQAK